MVKQLCKGLALVVGISLLFAACGRGNREQTNSRAPAQAYQPPVNTARAAAPLPPPDVSAVAADRPSAFDSPQATAHRQAAGSRKPVSSAAGAAEPPVLAIAPAADAAAPAVGALPTPPVVKPAPPDASQLPPVLKTLCCVSTATYEPVRPNGFQRLLQKVPGLRKLDSDTAAEPGYTPPQPVRDVRFAITPDASPLLMRQGQMDLKATVDASGRVTRVALLSPRDEKLADLVAAAAREWRFAPAEVNGSPVPADVMLHFDFDNTPAAQAAIDVSKVR